MSGAPLMGPVSFGPVFALFNLAFQKNARQCSKKSHVYSVFQNLIPLQILTSDVDSFLNQFFMLFKPSEL